MLRLRYITKKAKKSILSFAVSIEDLRILKDHFLFFAVCLRMKKKN